MVTNVIANYDEISIIMFTPFSKNMLLLFTCINSKLGKLLFVEWIEPSNLDSVLLSEADLLKPLLEDADHLGNEEYRLCHEAQGAELDEEMVVLAGHCVPNDAASQKDTPIHVQAHECDLHALVCLRVPQAVVLQNYSDVHEWV